MAPQEHIEQGEPTWLEDDEDERGASIPQPTLTEQLIESFKPDRLVAALMAGSVTGIISITAALAYASLLFSGEYAAYTSAGIGYILFGGIVISVIAALFSSANGAVAGVQDTGVAVLTVAAAAIAAALPDSAGAEAVAEARYVTLIASVMAATIATGLIFLALGFLKLGNLIRFIPYPVIGGFLGGSGLLLVRGAVTVMTDAPIMDSLLQMDLILKWLPGLAFAVALILIMQRISHFLVLPVLIVSSIAVFFAVLLISGTTPTAAREAGWLLGNMPSGGLWKAVPFGAFASVDWQLLFSQTGTLLSVVVVMVMGLLLNASGIELQNNQDIALNRELKVLGIANVLAGLGASPPGALYLGPSTLTYKMGASTRLVGVVQAIIMAMILFAGASVLGYAPKFVLGGLIMYFGLSFLIRWAIQSRTELQLPEYLIVLLILGVISFVGFLPGVAVGITLAGMLFVVNYSRINVVKHTLSGANHQSTVERPKVYRDLLQRKGHWLYMLKLQGFVFFGTANTLFHQFRTRIEDPTQQKLRYFLLDFRLVTGVDSSAMVSFEKMLRLAKQHNIMVIFTSLSKMMKERLEHDEPFTSQKGERWVAFDDLDHGMEWYENRVIADFESVGFAVKPPTMTHELQKMLPNRDAVNRLMEYFERLELPTDAVLVDQGDPPKGIYFIEEGQVQVQLQLHDRRRIRLRTLNSGTVIGELGTYLNVPATARVCTDRPTVLFFLSSDALKEMEANNPEISTAFHRFMAMTIAERLVKSAETMKVLLD